jgi:hypothetical protein
MRYKLWIGTLLTGALASIFLIGSEPARAFQWDPEDTSWITLGSEDLKGTSFDVWFYDATINSQNVAGLDAKATFTLDHDFGNPTDSLRFRVDLWNMADTNIWSSARLSGIAFAVAPDVTSATIDNDGLFDNVVVDDPTTQRDEAQYPENFKVIDVCYTDGTSCQGGQSGGLNLGETGHFYTTLNFGQNISSLRINMDNFAIRWQSLTSNPNGSSGTGYGNTYVGDSGVGYGEVPTPALIPSLLGAGIAALRRKQKEVENEEEKQLVKS